MPIDLDAQTPPRPPDLLVDRVTPGVRAEHAEADRTVFDDSGRRSVRDIEAALGSIGRELGSFPRVLDFGCGSGRVTRWLRPVAESIELHGCDIDELAIEWDAQNLDFARFAVNAPEPPLPYPDEHFDLVLNHSVLTHLDERYQDLWLPELRRVLRPGGFALLSVHGQRAFAITEEQTVGGGGDPAAWRAQLERAGILFIADDDYIGSSFPAFYHTTFHAPWYIFEHWTRWFDIRAYLPHSDLDFQDQVIVQRVDNPPGESALHARPGGLALPEPPTAPAPVASIHAPATITARSRTFARRVVNRVERIGKPTPAAPAAPATPAPAPADDPQPERISALVHSIVSKQGERITRLEQEVAELRRGAPSSTES